VAERSLFQRLKERKLVQWAVGYLAAAWAVVEATGLLVDQFDWPQIVGQAVTILAFVGIFVMLVLAWYHGEKGRQRLGGVEVLIIGGLLAGAAALISRLDGGSEAFSLADVRASDPRPAIAVLPCENFSPNPQDAYLAGGIHDELLLRLQRISGVASIGRTSVLQYVEDRPPAAQIARELMVGFVGECGVRKDADQIRLTFQLLDARTGRQLWAENFDRRLTSGGLFEIQGDIAQRIATELEAVLKPEEQSWIDTPPTESLAAYQHYLLGIEALNTGVAPGMREAVEHFREALVVDSTYAPGHAGLAEAYASLGYFNVLPPADSWPIARAAAERAIRLDDRLASAHTTLARVHAWFDWDWEAARHEFETAVSLNPNDAESRVWFSRFLSSMEEHDEAIEQAIQAVALEPLSLLTGFFRIGSLFYAGHRSAALELARQASQENPDEPLHYWWIALFHSAEGDFDAALPPLLRQIELMDPDVSDELGHLGYIYGRLGIPAKAQEILERLEARSADGTYVSPVAVAWIHIGLGDDVGAFEWLERGYETKANWILSLRVHPLFDPIRDDRRFRELSDRLGFVAMAN